jgi:hypothetical protein
MSKIFIGLKKEHGMLWGIVIDVNALVLAVLLYDDPKLCNLLKITAPLFISVLEFQEHRNLECCSYCNTSIANINNYYSCKIAFS